MTAMLGGCGEGEQPSGQSQPKVAAHVSAPINHSAPVNVVETSPDPAPQPKPLVSRETSPAHPTPPDYRAIGTEPFWGATLRGRTMVLERPDQPPRRYLVRDESDGRAIRFVGDGFTLTATEGPCSDGMSDMLWSDRVQIAFGDGTLKGCGGQPIDPRDMREEAF